MNKERLIQLADHLEFGTLGADVFNFQFLFVYVEGCGTNACALGECPTIFPDWEFRRDALFKRTYPVLKDIDDSGQYDESFISAQKWFEIDKLEADVLFLPLEDCLGNQDDENLEEYSVSINGVEFYAIKGTSTREEVARHIREFIKLKETA